MKGFPAAWWVVGGQAIEAFTGVRRVHEDIDLVVFSDDVPALRAQFAGVFHLWSNYGGALPVIDDKHPQPLHPPSQGGVRVNVRAPWGGGGSPQTPPGGPRGGEREGGPLPRPP